MISVIIPVFKAHETLQRAIDSACLALEGIDSEILCIVDDGMDYDAFSKEKVRIIKNNNFDIATGPGATRNRGLIEAKGDIIAFLDADDTWSEDYISSVLPFIDKEGVVFSRTRVVKNGDELGILGFGSSHIDIATFSKSGGSFWPVCKKEFIGKFYPIMSEDVLHSLEVLSLAGGSARFGGTYNLHLASGSVTASPDFSERLIKDYETIIKWVKEEKTRILPEHKSDVCDVFKKKKFWNDKFIEEGNGLSYYEYVFSVLNKNIF